MGIFAIINIVFNYNIFIMHSEGLEKKQDEVIDYKEMAEQATSGKLDVGDFVESPKQNKQESSLEVFEKIKTPEKLLDFMKDNIAYGFVGKNNKKIYAHDDEAMDADFEDEYYLQSPDELLESKYGVCWDSAELERHWFLKHGYEPKVYFMMFAKEEGTDLPTHTFLVYNKDDRWYWFEHSFGAHRGIHEYANLDELLEDVKKKQHEYAVKNRGATEEDFECLRFSEYDKPDYGLSPEEFVSNIFDKNPQLISKEQ